MKERIRELGRQATIWCVRQPNQDDFDAMWEEKFAELIVKECADIADKAEPYKANDLIRKHFGVEE